MDKNGGRATADLRLSMRNLNRRRANVAAPGYDRDAVGIGIVHFGPGAFHRGHQACYIDSLLETDPRWGICEIELRGRGLADALIEQDCLYTVAELETQPHYRIVGAIKEFLTAQNDSERAFARLCDPKVRLVGSTVTEKGYCLDGAGKLDLGHPDIVRDLNKPPVPVSLIGWVVEAVRRRRAAGVAPFTVMSCDNMVGNGQKLRAAAIALARAAGDDDLAAYIESEVRFACTMVDSITPAADDALRVGVCAAVGLVDEAPVHRERFLQWVVEDVLGPDAPDLASVGVSLTKDVEAYEQAKLRLLNGPHSTLAYAGLLMGYASVDEAMGDGKLAGFVEAMMREDIAPSLRTVAGFDFGAYISDILTRFRNPALTHRLYQIASDGSQKLPYRILDTTRDALAAGRPLTRLAVPIAAWMHFVRREAVAGRAFADPLTDALTEIGKACAGETRTDLERFFALTSVFGTDLPTDNRFVEAVSAAYQRIEGGSFLP